MSEKYIVVIGGCMHSRMVDGAAIEMDLHEGWYAVENGTEKLSFLIDSL